MHHGYYGPLTPGSSLAPSFPYCPCGPGASGIPGISGMPFNPGILENPWAKVDFWREKINTDWLEQQPQENNKKTPVHKSREISYNGNIGNKLEILLIFPFFDLSTICTIILFPHTLFPVGLWHCTIYDFPFLSFRSLLSFHTLDSWRFTAATWPFMTFILFYSHLSRSTIFTEWPLISFFSSYSRRPSRYLDTKLSLSSLGNN